ncbi:SDR family NAD(P)-dependent oxidoreductase [Nocardia carnea]|uniref:SDR family NAD(P)-dependent oxidoreductase n=1 Tax=Nocardia carnea TaxID=37328 RepID=UPI002457EF1E|nr:SDR family NAD(P)-dependent oxidoreductase [Nocardia carnea]
MTLEGKTVLITGSTGGIGKETARRLAALGARVILVGRDAERAGTAVAELRRTSGNTEIEAITADLSRLRDVRHLAEQVTSRVDRLDVLINNAGATRTRRELTEDGIETVFAVNVVAPFSLMHRLLPALQAADAARIVNITGGVPRGRIDLGNLQGEKAYVGLSFYNQTKLAQMAMSYAFAERLADTTVSLNVAYPGHAYTSMNKDLTAGAYPPLARPIVPLLRLAMPVLYGHRALIAATRSSVFLASSPAARTSHGSYFNSRAAVTPWPKAVLDETTRGTIWNLCERLHNTLQ